jgi:hypothetical protein
MYSSLSFNVLMTGNHYAAGRTRQVATHASLQLLTLTVLRVRTARLGICPVCPHLKSGSASGPLVYLNYGQREDYIRAAALVNLTGAVGIVRYGRVFRGVKVYLAEQVPTSDGHSLGVVVTA